MVLCDLSGNNPNVFLELGWALRADRPYVLIKDDETKFTFDLNQNSTFKYSSRLQPTLLEKEIPALKACIESTLNDNEKKYSLIKKLSIARIPIDTIKGKEAELALLKQIAETLRVDNSRSRTTINSENLFPWPSLLQGTMAIMNQAQSQLDTATHQDALHEVASAFASSHNLRFNDTYQMSILSTDGIFIYHDWSKFIGQKAHFVPREGFDIYGEILKYKNGVVAWTDHSSNSNEEPINQIRSNIAVYSTIEKLNIKVVIESHYVNQR